MPTHIIANNFDDGLGSLRGTIASAASGDTIIVPINIGQIDFELGQIEINKSLTIQGGGNVLALAGGFTGRCFYVSAGIVSISGFTILNFDTTSTAADGGAILNESTLTLSEIVFTSCLAANGGAIYNSSTVSVSGCHFNGCIASVSGGGIYNIGTVWQTTDVLFSTCESFSEGGALYNGLGATVELEQATFDSNQVTGAGGGIWTGGTCVLTDSSLLGNLATTQGQSIFNSLGTLTMTRCTVARTIGSAASIVNLTGTLTVDNSTFSKNGGGSILCTSLGVVDVRHSTIVGSAGYGIATDASGCIIRMQNSIIVGNTIDDLSIDPAEFISEGYNAIGVNVPAITTTTGDIDGLVYGDLFISALADNGGYTETMALGVGSPCLDTGTNAGAPATDQRGEPRINNGTIDMGAYEFQGSSSPDAAQAAANTSACYLCYGATGVQAQMLALLSQIVTTLNPMAATDPQSLLNASRCYQCYGPMSAGESMMLGLVSLMQTAIVSGAAGSVWGSGSPVGVVTPGYKGQIYTDLDIPGGVWIATGTTNADWRQFIGP